MEPLKLITIATLLSTIFVLQACGKKNRPDDVPVDQPKLEEPENDKELRLRGYQEMSTLVESSIAKTTNDFSFQRYIGGEIDFFAGAVGLAPLMGYYSADPANPGWKNITANTISTATYLVAFDALALDIAAYCKERSPELHKITLSDAAIDLMMRYCDNPNLSDDEFKQIWAMLTANMPPASEFPSWLANLKTVSAAPTAERFETMVTTALSSPWLVFKN